MRKRLIASVFITFLLCVPALAGHTVAGGGWCPDGAPGCVPDGNGMVLAESTQDTPVDLGSEMLFVLAALILVLRYKS